MKAWIATHTGLPSFETPPGEWEITRGNQVIAKGNGITYLSDALAPLGTPLQYKINQTTYTLTRPDAGIHTLADADGRVLAQVRVIEDEWEVEQSSSVFFPRHRVVPLVRLRRREPRITGSVQVATEGRDRGFFDYSSPVMLIHSPSGCVFGSRCPLPSVRLVIPDAQVRSRVGARRDKPTVLWDFSYTLMASSDSTIVGGMVPVVTYEEASAAGLSLSAGSFADVCRKVAGMP